ncbi:membrane dipeptidase [Pseudomonadota bacterium]
MPPQDRLHNQCTVIDGLIVGKPGRALYEAMHQGGLTAVNFTCSIWEGFTDSMREIAEWKRRFREHSDILKAVYTTADIEQARRERRVGVILGWQNSSGFEDCLPYVGLFHELGLRVVQITYHTANLSGSGCLEGRDGGLTDFGQVAAEVIEAARCMAGVRVGDRYVIQGAAIDPEQSTGPNCIFLLSMLVQMVAAAFDRFGKDDEISMTLPGAQCTDPGPVVGGFGGVKVRMWIEPIP